MTLISLILLRKRVHDGFSVKQNTTLSIDKIKTIYLIYLICYSNIKLNVFIEKSTRLNSIAFTINIYCTKRDKILASCSRKSNHFHLSCVIKIQSITIFILHFFECNTYILRMLICYIHYIRGNMIKAEIFRKFKTLPMMGINL